MTFGKFMTNFRAAMLLKQDSGLYGFKGDPFFDSLQPKLYNGSSAQLRGGGAVVKLNNSEDRGITANKGADVTYTFVSEDAESQPGDKTPLAKPKVNPVSNKDIFVKGTTEANAKVSVKLGSKVIGTVSANSDGKFNVHISKQKAGTKLTIFAEDAARNKSTEVIVTVIDKTVPVTPIVKEVSDKGQESNGKSTTLGSANANKSGNYRVTLKTSQKAGTVLSITATDKAGNVSTAKKVTVKDKTAPKAPTINKVTTKSSVVTGKAEVYSTVYVKAHGKVIGSGKANKASSFSIKIAKQKTGTVLSVYSKDKAGNVSKTLKIIVQK